MSILRHHHLLALIGLVTTGVASEAAARSIRVLQVPNGTTFGCLLCHGKNPDGTFNRLERNVFGHDVERTLKEGVVDWRAIYALDSDGDGFTNGEELADPNGTSVATPGVVPTHPADPLHHPVRVAPEPPIDEGLQADTVEPHTNKPDVDKPVDASGPDIAEPNLPDNISEIEAHDAPTSDDDGAGMSETQGCSTIGGASALWVALGCLSQLVRRGRKTHGDHASEWP